ncbi:FANTASTIC FOUR 3 [Spatholobus suberectus]|nr:FANTASTIC FOUR 3 [Spatholobus suberectus]
MAAIVCQGLQSHLRLPSSKPTPPQLIDLAIKFWDSNSTIKPHNEENSFPLRDKSAPSNPTWSFLEALSNVAKEPSLNQTTYVHPQQRRSPLCLSPKSLELCTENLGNESGTDIVAENNIDTLSPANCAGGNFATGEQTQPRQLLAAKKAKAQNFPPPLTTIRGSESLRVRPHREDGRLVIEVTKVPPSPSCFQAERSHGRLRLCFLTNHTPSFDPEEEDDVEENEPLPNEKEFEKEIIGQTKDAGEETEGEEEECVACGWKESDIIMEKYERPRRCKEGGDHENNELLNWSEPRWVVTS